MQVSKQGRVAFGDPSLELAPTIRCQSRELVGHGAGGYSQQVRDVRGRFARWGIVHLKAKVEAFWLFHVTYTLSLGDIVHTAPVVITPCCLTPVLFMSGLPVGTLQ